MNKYPIILLFLDTLIDPVIQIFIIDTDPYCLNKYLKNKLKLELITTIYECAFTFLKL